MLGSIISILKAGFSGEVLHSIFLLAPFWVPLLFILVWWDLWLNSKQRTWVKNQGSVLLEIKLPREMPKSPQSIELFLNTIFNIFPGNLLKIYFEGAMRPWFSLELVSIDGVVHFYIWTTKPFRSRVETQLYAQFPDIEVQEVPDYSLGVHWNPEQISIGWIGQFKLIKADAYPIKTYIDYGLDKDPKEEFKHDPLVSILEFLGSLKKGEQAWIQILIQGHSKDGLTFNRLIPKPDWKSGIEKEIKEIVKKASIKPEDEKTPKFIQLSEGQKKVVDAIERNATKTAFDTMIRAAYFAEKSVFNPINIGGLLGGFGQFGAANLNGIRPDFNAAFTYPWQDFGGKIKAMHERQLLEAYKRRSFFHPPFKNFHGKPFVLTVEELATLWHFPSSEVAATPTLTRIPSKKAEAPANLPV